MSLHALLYCERLFYLEEVEEIRVADAAVYAGRRLHAEEVAPDDETPENRSLEVSSETLGTDGQGRRRAPADGVWVAIEHKRGRCRRDDDGRPQAWPSDRIQAVAYAVLLEEALGEPVPQARVRYHADGVTAFVDSGRGSPAGSGGGHRTGARAAPQHRAAASGRKRKALPALFAGASLPARRGARLAHQEESLPSTRPPRLFPSRREEQTLAHRLAARPPRPQRCGLAADQRRRKAENPRRADRQRRGPRVWPGIDAGHPSVCQHGVAVQWFTMGGKFAAGTASSPGRVQQRIRQYAGLSDPATRLDLARRLVEAKIDTQRRYVLRASREETCLSRLVSPPAGPNSPLLLARYPRPSRLPRCWAWKGRPPVRISIA